MIAVVMILSVVAIVPSFAYVEEFSNLSSGIDKNTYLFQEKFNGLIHNVVEYYVVLKNEEHIRSSPEDINSPDVSSQIPSNINETTEVDNGDVEYKLDRLHTIKQHLADTVNFIYYIENVNTKEIFTNIEEENPKEFIKKQSSYVYYNQYKVDNDQSFNYNEDITRMLKGTDYEVHGAVYRSLRLGDDFFTQDAQFNQLKKNFPTFRGVLIVAGILFFMTFGLLLKITGRDLQGEIIDSNLDRVYNEIQVVIALCSIWFTAYMITPVFNSIFKEYNEYTYFNMRLSEYISLALIINILLLLSLSFLRQYKSKRIIKNTISYELIKLCFKTKYFKPGIILIFIAYVSINAILGILLLGALSGGTIVALFALLVFMSFNIVAFVFLQRSLQSLNKIMEVTKQISQGNFQDVVDVNQISLSFRDFYTDIMCIKDGMKNAIQEAIKGERLKTELITNVSHDLKTPLTSIINYVDLLKREDLQGEKTLEYIKILDEKSERLKQLIDDLLEASKASSGNLTVEFQELDLNELIQQSVGECQDKFAEANLEVRVNSLEQNIPIIGDSKHMWRIAENLLINAVKYAMSHTRVYIDTGVKDDYGVITIKNVSAEPLDISPEQLTQRFVRGDESRTTEGSGLGLSIAESLTNIQGGKFSIDIDGDLFKVMVYIPLKSKR